MAVKHHHESVDDPIFLSPADALSMLEPLPEGELQFTDRYGSAVEHDRTLVALPSGDEVFTDKRAGVWSQPMRPTYLPLGELGVVKSIYREVITEGVK